MKNNLLIALIVAFVFGAVGFYAGTRYQASKQTAFFGNGRRQIMGATGQFPNRAGARQVIGDILSQDDKSITVKLPDGSSKIVFLAETTKINKASEAAKIDLKKGEKVAIFGLENSDGSITANTVQINPILRRP